MDHKEEIRKLRIQMAGDFDFVTLALRDMGVTFRSGMDGTVKRLDESAQKSNELAQRVSELAQRVHEVAQGVHEAAQGIDQASKNVSETARRVSYLGREMEERFSQVEGRMRLQDQRFGLMLVAVEGAIDDWRPELEAVKARLDRLEERNHSAA